MPPVGLSVMPTPATDMLVLVNDPSSMFAAYEPGSGVRTPVDGVVPGFFVAEVDGTVAGFGRAQLLRPSLDAPLDSIPLGWYLIGVMVIRGGGGADSVTL